MCKFVGDPGDAGLRGRVSLEEEGNRNLEKRVERWECNGLKTGGCTDEKGVDCDWG
jgi:hypothetical protein